MYDELVAYIKPDVLATPYTQDYLRRMRAHLANVSRVEGLFVDTEVSGIRFRGQRRRIRATVYRRRPGAQELDRDGIGAAEQLKNVCERFEASLRQGGVPARRCTGRDFYEWLLPWFNPRPGIAGSAAELLRIAPYPGDDELPFGRDFADLVLLAKPRSDLDRGLWYFDELPHVALTFQQLRNKPVVGHLTAERQFDDGRFYALFDKLPDGAVLSLTVTIRPQDKLRAHVDAIERAATGDAPEAELSRENCRIVKRRMAEGDKLLPLNMVLYLRGDDELDLRRKVNHVNATLLPSGLKFIDQRQDLVALTAYIRGLPMAFDPVFDLRQLKRSRLVFSSDVARLLPVYGRARGTGRPGMIYFNRAGEPLMFDPLHKQDRKKNAHRVLFGPTGAGKSAACVHDLMLQMAVHRPRLFLLEVGGSFTLLGEHFRRPRPDGEPGDAVGQLGHLAAAVRRRVQDARPDPAARAHDPRGRRSRRRRRRRAARRGRQARHPRRDGSRRARDDHRRRRAREREAHARRPLPDPLGRHRGGEEGARHGPAAAADRGRGQRAAHDRRRPVAARGSAHARRRDGRRHEAVLRRAGGQVLQPPRHALARRGRDDRGPQHLRARGLRGPADGRLPLVHEPHPRAGGVAPARGAADHRAGRRGPRHHRQPAAVAVPHEDQQDVAQARYLAVAADAEPRRLPRRRRGAC